MNTYSRLWFETFLETIPAAQTEKEISFITQFIPRPAHVLDLCCGEGRHARGLAARGYNVIGVDRDASAIAIARREIPNARFIVGDMRDLKSVRGNFDAVICMWQSFGDFDDATNADVLDQINKKLAIGGRFVLDIFQREFFKAHQGKWTLERAGRAIMENKWMSGNRLIVELDYGDGATDHFERRLFTPDEIAEQCARSGLARVLVCADFDANKPATAQNPRMQLVFEKR
jgi:SAM-dependent methyltransferase